MSTLWTDQELALKEKRESLLWKLYRDIQDFQYVLIKKYKFQLEEDFNKLILIGNQKISEIGEDQSQLLIREQKNEIAKELLKLKNQLESKEQDLLQKTR